MDDDDFREPAYPPSILIGGAALVAVLAGIVVSVLMVSATSVDIHPMTPGARTPHAVTTAPQAPTAAAEPPAQNGLEAFLNRLTPQLPALDRLLQAP